MGPRPYTLVFYAEPNGDEPVARWLRELPDVERYALGSAMDGLLQQGGPLLPTRNLFRVFFHPFGRRLLLLLVGYDKAKRPSPTYQGQQVRLARKRLATWQERQDLIRRQGP